MITADKPFGSLIGRVRVLGARWLDFAALLQIVALTAQ
jgi:hypothetical protein